MILTLKIIWRGGCKLDLPCWAQKKNEAWLENVGAIFLYYTKLVFNSRFLVSNSSMQNTSAFKIHSLSEIPL